MELDQIFALPTVKLAQRLLGSTLEYSGPAGLCAGRIVETEAYIGAKDAASHSFRGPTPRTQVMFGPPGHAYIYFTYGMHWCFNITAQAVGHGEAVLIRALEPTLGIELMQARRGLRELRSLCSGPAKLVQALGIDPLLNGHDLRQPPLRITPAAPVRPSAIITTSRIGISRATDLPLRFYIKENPFVSKR